jgi:glycosyltransferase involved in cell wall biosynthesis
MRLDEGIAMRAIEAPPAGGTVATARWFAGLLKRERPELLLTYNWGAIEAVMGAVIAPVCPVIHTEDGFGPDEAGGLKARRVWTRRAVLRSVYRMAVPSRTLERIALERYWLPRERVVFIPNAVDTERFRPGWDVEMRAELGLGEGEFVVGTVGRLRGEKDLPALVRRFKEAGIAGARLVVVGDGPERGAIEAAAREAGIEGQCVFTGEQKATERYFRAFDVFAMSSITEQMPVGLLEAMSSGLPAVCTAAGDTAEILEGAPERQVFDMGDAEGYVAALRRLAAEPEMRQRTGGWNRKTAVEGYSLEAMVGRWRHLYRQALDMKTMPAGKH